jgi:hypothetical protein
VPNQDVATEADSDSDVVDDGEVVDHLVHLESIFRTFFSRGKFFQRNLPRNFEGKLFFETFFLAKFQFPQHFLGNFFPEKMYEKFTTGVDYGRN